MNECLAMLVVVARKGGPPTFIWIAWAVFAVLGVVGAILTSRKEKARRETLSRTALESGFSFEEKGDPFGEEERNRLQLFSRYGKRASFKNILRGSAAGGDSVVCDHGYQQGKSHAMQTIAAFKFSGTKFPQFLLCPKHLVFRLLAVVGHPDINFESNPEFSGRYQLRGPDENAIRTLFNPEVIAYFERIEKGKEWYVEAGGDWLLVYRPGKRIKPDDLRSFVDETAAVASALHKGKSSFGW